jgi:hypothetical protein
LGIVSSQIETKRVFSIANIYTNLWHFQLDIDNLEMHINIYKNWPDDGQVGGLTSMGAIHRNGISLNGRKWRINWQAWAFGIEWKQALCKI